MSHTSRVLVESVTTKLSLVVDITDDHTGSGIIGDVEVSLQDRDIHLIKNPSRYYLFLDLKENSYTILVKGGDYYFDTRIDDVNPDELDEHYPVVNVTLRPTPAYPFNNSATLIRGCILDSLNKGISGAVLSIEKTDIGTETTTNGEFVIYFRGLKDYDVVTEDGKKMINIKGKDPVLVIRHPDYKNKNGKIIKKKVTVKVEEGETTSISITYP